jgi:high affinity cGMP-specific 3',5'-cyclic phosphodiesterase 9
MLFAILNLESCAIFSTVSKDDMAKARKSMIKIVMATDMAKHGELVGAFNKITAEFSWDLPEHRQQVWHSSNLASQYTDQMCRYIYRG